MHFAVMFIGSTLFALQQLSGINAVFYFSSATFESFGVSSKMGNTCVGICNLLGIYHWLNSFVFFLGYSVNCCIFVSILLCMPLQVQLFQ